MKITKVRVDQLVIDSKNARRHGDENMKAIGSSLKRFGQVEPLVVQAGTMKVIGGNGRLEQMRRDGEKHAYVHVVDLDDTQAAALGIALNRSAELGTWDDAALKAVLDSLPPDIQADVGFFDGALAAAIAEAAAPGPAPSLSDRFLVPPFSVLDARQGYWQDRKRQWLSMGIRSELGRGGGPCAPSAAGDTPSDRHAKYSASPGGSPVAATRLGKNRKTQRGDGMGRPLKAPNPGGGGYGKGSCWMSGGKTYDQRVTAGNGGASRPRRAKTKPSDHAPSLDTSPGSCAPPTPA